MLRPAVTPIFQTNRNPFESQHNHIFNANISTLPKPLQKPAGAMTVPLMRPAGPAVITSSTSTQRHGLNKSNKARLQKILAPIDAYVDQSEWNRFKIWMGREAEGKVDRPPVRKKSSRLDEARILFRIEAVDFLYYIQGGDDKEKDIPRYGRASFKLLQRQRASHIKGFIKTDRQQRLDRLQRFLAKAPTAMRVLRRYPLLAGVAFRATEAETMSNTTSGILLSPPTSPFWDNSCYPSTDSMRKRADQGGYVRHLDLRKNRSAPGKRLKPGVDAFCKRFMRIVDKQIRVFMKEVKQEEQVMASFTATCAFTQNVTQGGQTKESTMATVAKKEDPKKSRKKLAKAERKASKRASMTWAEANRRKAKRILRSACYERRKRGGARAAERSLVKRQPPIERPMQSSSETRIPDVEA